MEAMGAIRCSEKMLSIGRIQIEAAASPVNGGRSENLRKLAEICSKWTDGVQLQCKLENILPKMAEKIDAWCLNFGQKVIHYS